MDLGGWLRSLGLEQYEAVFRENAIDETVLPDLTDQDLEKLGVLLGHRRKLLRAISSFETIKKRAPAVAVVPASASPLPLDTAERRQVTVMFSDLVGSTALSARMDPEDLREVIAAYHKCVAEIVRHFDGFVAQYLGDGVLVYFGYPQAHEDDAERAVRAGLELVAAVGALKTRVSLQTRIGIATGLVVVGDLMDSGIAPERGIVGETPNLAARLQGIAEPNMVVIAESTRRLLGNLFDIVDLGARELKGVAWPVRAWAALRASAVESRFEALRTTVLTALVGREEESELLLRRWSKAKSGEGQVVLISGEPGIGKSRIAAGLEERLKADPHLRLGYFCSPYHQDSALFPVIDQLGRAAGFARDDKPAAKLAKLESLLSPTTPSDEDVAILADLLSLSGSERYVLPNLSPQRKKERTLETLIRTIEGLARQQPVVMVFEDAHWIDPTSRELLDLTIERVGCLPVLLIVTFRPEFQPHWTGQPQVSLLALNRLSRREQTVLIGQIAGGKALPDDVVAQIADRTDGVPLFVEEFTKSVLESGLLRDDTGCYVLDRAISPFAIPTSLQDSLMARIDRLASARLVAQIGAAIGREFSFALLHIVSRLPEDELQAALARLIASELVFQRGTPPEAVYTFKHALVQDAAHGSLLRSSRQHLHAQIAEALETHSPELRESQPELFAQHYAEAGLVEKSAGCWGMAGHRSVAHGAIVEAAAQFQKGLDQLALLPDNPERQRQELEYCSSLSAALRAAKGQAAPQTGQVYARARELWERLGSPSEFLQIPYGQSRYHAHRGEVDLAERLDEDLLRLSHQRNDVAGLILGHLSSGINLMFAGMFASSRAHLEKALALYDPVSHHSLVRQAGVYPRVFSQAYLSNVLFCLGFPDQAVTRSNAIISEARSLAHPPSLAGSLAIGMRLLSLIGDDAALHERVRQLIAVATEQGFPHWRAQGAIYRGWVKVNNGNMTEGIALLRSGTSAYRASGAELLVPHYFALMAAAYELVGQVDGSSTLLDDSLQIVERTGERWFAAELNRLKGQLLLRQGHSDAAEEHYRNALGIAQKQEAKLWELRAAMSMARLLRDRGKRHQARDLLAPVYGWFTEGFGTLDLKEAKTFLNTLVA
jgi:class 3 adenylate cyclase/predicted ATPase